VGEDQEHCLEGIVRIRGVPEASPAYVIDHRPAPPHQRTKGRLIAHRDEALEQLLVRQEARLLRRRERAQLLQQNVDGRVGHTQGPIAVS
jgi:hypothetical protein